jgi:ABC-type lipoprotein export system ATPase subunit
MGELVLRLEGVARGYRRGRKGGSQVLSGVSFAVGAGEFVGVLGGRGEGKTTLLELAAGMALPEAGKVWFEGRDLASCSDEERSDLLGDRIAWMPRENMAEFEVLEGVALPLAMGRADMDAAKALAMEALERVGAEDCADRGWEELSDWDRLLVTLARGYAIRPRLMVLDDLLDAHGAAGARQAGELLREFAQELGCGVLAGASDLRALLAAHRVMRFDGEGGVQIRPEPNLAKLDDARRRAG